MYNDHISYEEARELVKQRRQEAENYALQKRLGFGDPAAARRVFLLVLLLAAAAVSLLI